MPIVFDDEQPKKSRIVFDDETDQPASSGVIDQIGSAVGMSPLGMVSRGADAAAKGISKVLEMTDVVPVPRTIQEGAKRLFQGSRALGVGVAKDMASRYTGQSPQQTTQRTVAAMRPGFEPDGMVEKAGSYVGENAPVMAAGVVSPTVAGPLAIMAQQAQSGRVSPIPAAIPAVGAANKLFRATGLQERVVPPLLKATKGIPLNATKMAIKDPSILDLPGTSASIQGKAQNIINTIKEADRKVGTEFGNAYKERGMVSPIEKIITSGESPAIPFEELRVSYQNAMKGEFPKGFSAQQKLAHLTELKRSLQDQANYPAPGQQLAPSQGSKNGAIKQMAADIDELRGTLADGDKLALVDDAYVEIKELKHRLMSEFRDPYKGQDYLNRLLKGNTDWLTSGRNAGKMGAIERIEEITGKKVLEPALKEMAAAYLNNPDVLSLPSWSLSSIISTLFPTKMFFGRSKTLPSAGTVLSETAPHRDQQNTMFKNPASKRLFEKPQAQEVIPFPVVPAPEIKGKKSAKAQPKGVLDKEKAREYLAMAGGDKQKARQLSLNDGWRLA